MQITQEVNINFNDYTVEQYKSDLDRYGMDIVWTELLNYCLHNATCEMLKVGKFGELYEIGLAHTNKIAKKEMGKYFTPMDVAKLMSDWMADLKGTNVCDVCCGTGNLILAYLNRIGKRRTINLLKNQRLYLYDVDPLALKICIYSIGILYGKEYINDITAIHGDFLDKDVVLPDDCKVISNPPYFKITKIGDNWEQTDVVKQSRELYSSIMEKIVKQSRASVVITPYSFIGGEKFYSLRQELNHHNGFIVSFDNIPGSIFNSRKHGIFNTNSTNSVRAAITVVENKRGKSGFRISPLIRFKNSERDALLNATTLNSYIPTTYQIVNTQNKAYHKCFVSLIPLMNAWAQHSDAYLRNLVSQTETEYNLCTPNSCRYFTVAAVRDLNRTGKHTIYFNNELDRNLAYCLINSSLAYWHWRLYDGGITYPIGLLLNIPIFFDKISNDKKEKLNSIAKEMQSVEHKYLSYKKNAGVMQENIKFPDKYREEINRILLDCLGVSSVGVDVFNIIHANSAFNTTNDEKEIVDDD